MDTSLVIIQTSIIVATNIIVGIILKRQIKSQKEIIESYKGLVEATSPEKIIALHQREIDKIKQTMTMDIDELKTQVYELATYADVTIDGINDILNSFKSRKKLYTRKAVISEDFPHCKKILEELRLARENQKMLDSPKA